jgi:hypothetical protein
MCQSDRPVASRSFEYAWRVVGGWYSKYKGMLRTHPGGAFIAFLTLSGITMAATIGLGPTTSDIDRNAKVLVVLFGFLSIACLWGSWLFTCLPRMASWFSLLSLGLSIMLIFAMVAPYVFGAAPTNAESGKAQPPQPSSPPIPAAATEGWQPWHPVAIPQKFFNRDTSRVTAVTRTNGEIDLFLIDNDGQVWNASREGDTWRWDKMPNNMKLSPGTRQVTAVSMTDKSDPTQDTLVVFAIGDHSQIWETVLDGRHWTDWRSLPPSPLQVDHRSQSVAVASRKAGKLDLFVVGSEGEHNAVLSTSWEDGLNNNIWNNWFTVLPENDVSFPGGEQVSVVVRSPVNLDLFVISGGKVYNAHWDARASEWSDWTDSGLDHVSPKEQGKRTPLPMFADNQAVTGVSKSRSEGRTSIDLFAIASTGLAQSNWWREDGEYASRWFGWFDFPYNYFDRNQQLAVVARSPHNLDLFGLSPEGQLLMSDWRDPENEWSKLDPPKNLEGPLFSLNQQIAAASPSPAELDLFVIGNDGTLWTAAWPS